MTQVPLSKQQKELTQGGIARALEIYKELSVGNRGYLFWISFEAAILLGTNLAGVVGLGLRSIWYQIYFKTCGKRPAIGRGVGIKNPYAMSLGNTVLIDDGVSLEAKGEKASINIGSCVSIGKNTIVVAKDGEITLHDGVNIGSQCRIATQSRVEIGESTLVAAFSYIGPGNHKRGDGTKALIEEEMEIKGGVKIGARCWIGAHTTILDGVTIGDDAIVGAHSMVREDVPAGATVVGVPAKKIA
jgi:acetyltransferase-like isoleucine patch superfamily enzyme